MPESSNTTEPVIEDVTKSTDSYIIKNDKKLLILYAVGTIVFAILIIRLQLDLRLLLIPFAIGAIWYGSVKTKMKRLFTQQFGASIGFTYSETADITSVSGKLFQIGHGQYIYDVLSGKTDDRDSRIFSYRFTVGSGKNSHTYDYTIFETTFANRMPDIVLTSHDVGEFMGFSLFDGTTHVELEGDFNKYFSLKVPKGYETTAYEILPPNVMAELIDHAKNFNFEFNGNKLYIYTPGLITVREKLQAMFDLAHYLDDLFSRSTRAVNISAAN